MTASLQTFVVKENDGSTSEVSAETAEVIDAYRLALKTGGQVVAQFNAFASFRVKVEAAPSPPIPSPEPEE